MSAIWWALTGLGGLGIVALVLMAIFAPPMLAVVWKIVKDVLVWAVGTRIGVGLLVAIVVFFFTSIYQHQIDKEDFDRRTAAFERAQAARDARITRETTDLVTKKLKEQQVEDQKADDDEAEFEKGLNPDDACLVGDDVDRLRGLAGQAPSQHHRGMFKARPAR